MAIQIDKALNRKYIIEALEGFEKYTLWDQENRNVLDVPAHYEQVVGGGLLVVADGTLVQQIELASVTPIADGQTIAVGSAVNLVDAYEVVVGGTYTVVTTVTDPTTEVALSDITYTVNGSATPALGNTVNKSSAYAVLLGGLNVVADGYKATEIEVSSVTPVLSGTTVVAGMYVTWKDDTYKTVQINVHRYGKLGPWKTGKKYFIGNCVTFEGCLYQATADVDGTDTTFPTDKFQMVGADSLLQIRQNKLDDPTTVKQDSLYWLKEDQMNETDPTKVDYAAGIYTFTKSTASYALYRAYEDKEIEYKSFFEDVKPEDLGYTGDKDKVVNSLYLHSTLEKVTKTIQEEITDLEDVLDNANYYILNNREELDAYDLTTLPDNSMNIFLVKQDNTIEKYDTIATPGTYITVETYKQYVAEYEAGTRTVDPATEYTPVYKFIIAGTDPTEYESTLYACVAYDSEEYPKKTRIVEYVGKLAWGAESLDILIDKKIFDALHDKTTKTVYVKSTDADALTVVADGALANQIELAAVTPVVIGTTPVVSGSVSAVTAYQAGTTYTIVADGTTPLAANELELSTVNGKLVDGQTAFVVGDTADAVTAYETSVGGLQIVADGYKATEIELSDVTPTASAYPTPAVGDTVKLGTEDVYTWKFILRSEADAETLQKLSHEKVTYTDPEGVEADVTVDYLTYDGTKQMPYEFETKTIDFTDSTQYDAPEEGEIVTP